MKTKLLILITFIIAYGSYLSSLNAQTNRANTKKSTAYKANYQRVSSFAASTFEIRGGTLWAWGQNTFGQLGDGTIINRTSPVQIGINKNWISIASGTWHTMGLKSDGTLWAWGYNSYGELGEGTTVQEKSPVQIGTENNWVSIAAGWSHSIGLKSDGTLWAWGDNFHGELGDGTNNNKTGPVQIGTDNKWVSITAGDSYSAGLKSDGTLWTWGYNYYGELGDGTTADQNTPIKIGTENLWVGIAAAGYHTLGLKSNGTLWAWGDNSSGQLGDSTSSNKSSPIQVGIDNKWVSIAPGLDHSLGLKSDGTIWTWGKNNFGQLGDGTFPNNRNTPVQAGTDNKWVSIAAGCAHSIGVKSDGSIWSCGLNDNGQLGNGTNIEKNTFEQISIVLRVWLNAEAGSYHTSGLKSNGCIWSFGHNAYGQLGDGTTVTKTSPVQTGTDNKWVSTAAGALHTIGLKSDGTLWAWGWNSYGQLGDGTAAQRKSPVQTGTLNTWVSIGAGSSHTICLKSDGTIWACGNNADGQLGNGTTENKNSLIQIGTDNKWVSITAGGTHTLGLKSDGTLWAWGSNFNGELGDGTIINKSSPVKIGTENKWVGIAAGDYHSLGLKSDGTIWAWGGNDFGQLGNGTIEKSRIPTQIGYDNKWVGITAGGYHTLALKSDGTIWACGYNGNGQLGNGTSADETSMVLTGVNNNNNNNWISIIAGGLHSIGVKADRAELCGAGDNYFGALGDGTTTNRSIFTCISNCTPPPSPAAATAVICAANSANLSASGSGTISWYSQTTGGNYLGAGGIYTTPILTSNTTYYVQDSTCEVSDSRTAMNVIVNPLPQVTANTSDTIVCAGTAVTLTGGGASSYTWSGGVNDGVSFIPDSTESYIVTGTDRNNCSNSQTKTVIVNPLPIVNANASASRVCIGTEVTLTGGGACSYAWTGGITDGVGFIPSSTYTYLVTGTDRNNCSSTASTKITVSPLPDISINLIGDTITANQNGAVYQWLDTSNVNSAIAGAVNQSYTAAANGNYAVIVTMNGCSDTSKYINVNSIKINETVNNNNQLIIYPNPGKGVFTIQSTSDGVYSITNDIGQTIQKFELNGANKYTINIENLSNGMYFIVGVYDNQILKQKVVVTK